MDPSVNTTSSPALFEENVATVGVHGTVLPVTLSTMHTVSELHGFDVIRHAVYVPSDAYVFTGFWAVDVLPSPKSHDQLDASVELSTNITVRSDAMVSNEATVLLHPPRATITLVQNVSEPQALVAVRHTL